MGSQVFGHYTLGDILIQTTTKINAWSIITTLIFFLNIISEGAEYWVKSWRQNSWASGVNLIYPVIHQFFSPLVFPCFLHSSSIGFLVAVIIQKFCSGSIQPIHSILYTAVDGRSVCSDNSVYFLFLKRHPLLYYLSFMD